MLFLQGTTTMSCNGNPEFILNFTKLLFYICDFQKPNDKNNFFFKYRTKNKGKLTCKLERNKTNVLKFEEKMKRFF